MADLANPYTPYGSGGGGGNWGSINGNLQDQIDLQNALNGKAPSTSIRYDTTQSITSAQQLQAQQNIGLASQPATDIIDILSTPPSSPSAGDKYIIGPSPTGAWSAATLGQFATYNAGSWSFSTPTTNQIISFSDGTNATILNPYYYSGSAYQYTPTWSSPVIANFFWQLYTPNTVYTATNNASQTMGQGFTTGLTPSTVTQDITVNIASSSYQNQQPSVFPWTNYSNYLTVVNGVRIPSGATVHLIPQSSTTWKSIPLQNSANLGSIQDGVDNLWDFTNISAGTSLASSGVSVGTVALSGLYPNTVAVSGTSTLVAAFVKDSTDNKTSLQITSAGIVSAGACIIGKRIKIPDEWKDISRLPTLGLLFKANSGLSLQGLTTDNLACGFQVFNSSNTYLSTIYPNTSSFCLNGSSNYGSGNPQTIQIPVNAFYIQPVLWCPNATSGAISCNLKKIDVVKGTTSSGGLYGPVGSIIQHSSKTPPMGYLYCNGQAVSRTQYNQLFAVIGTTYGSGNGSTTFNVPDLRGRFLRGQNDTSGNDPDAASRTALNAGGNTGDNIGSVQGDQFASHSHFFARNRWYSFDQIYNSNPGSIYASGDPTTSASYSAFTDNAGGNETRPKNVNVAYHICYQSVLMSSNVPNGPVEFYATATSASGDLQGGGSNIILNSPGYINNTHPSAYNAATGAYTAPYTGYYSVTLNGGGSSNWGANGYLNPSVLVESVGTQLGSWRAMGAANVQGYYEVSGTVYALAGQKIAFRQGGDSTSGSGISSCNFYAFKISYKGQNQNIPVDPAIYTQYTSNNSPILNSSPLIFNTQNSNIGDSSALYNNVTGNIQIPANGIYEIDFDYILYILTSLTPSGTLSYNLRELQHRIFKNSAMYGNIFGKTPVTPYSGSDGFMYPKASSPLIKANQGDIINIISSLLLASVNTGSPTATQNGGISTAPAVTDPYGTFTTFQGTLTAYNNAHYDFYYNIGGLTPGSSYALKYWIKLGTATNLNVALTNTGGFNTMNAYDKAWTAANSGINTSTWVELTHQFVAPATGSINIHWGATQENSGVIPANPQTAGTVFISDQRLYGSGLIQPLNNYLKIRRVSNQ